MSRTKSSKSIKICGDVVKGRTTKKDIRVVKYNEAKLTDLNHSPAHYEGKAQFNDHIHKGHYDLFEQTTRTEPVKKTSGELKRASQNNAKSVFTEYMNNKPDFKKKK